MTGFRLLFEDEDAANQAAAPANAERLLHPPQRWHCGQCGRFVPFAGVRKLPPWPGEADEHEYQGTCKTHGQVDVVWGEQ
jgi:hypothetical protein